MVISIPYYLVWELLKLTYYRTFHHSLFDLDVKEPITIDIIDFNFFPFFNFTYDYDPVRT